jgi:hypothetical protein
MAQSLVPGDFVVPQGFLRAFAWSRSGPKPNEADRTAWMSSIDHIRATPGFPDSRWTPLGGLSLAENLRDLQRNAEDVQRRVNFTCTVLDDGDRVIGCVYIYPSPSDSRVPQVQSWVSANRAELDLLVHDAVANWLATEWPFTDFRYRATGEPEQRSIRRCPSSCRLSRTGRMRSRTRCCAGWPRYI